SMTGMSLLVPLLTWLILTTGWRTTYVLIAVGVLVGMLPISLWVIRESPESMGLAADGATPSAKATEAVARERVSAITAMQTLAFWQLAGSFFTCGFSMSLLSAHGIPMLTDHGYSPMFGSWTSGWLGGSSMGCTVMLGALSDRFGRTSTTRTSASSRGCSRRGRSACSVARAWAARSCWARCPIASAGARCWPPSTRAAC